MRVALLLGLSACTVVKGNGTAASESVDVAGVIEFENTSSITLDVVGGAAEEAGEFFCDENLMKYIEVVVDDDALTLRVEAGVEIEPEAACGLEASVALVQAIRSSGSGATTGTGDLTDFEEARVSGSGALNLEGIASPNVELRNSGSGALKAAGTTDRVDIDGSGSGAIDAVDLIAVDAVVRNSGSGAISLTANRDVEVHLSGSGPVDVYGEQSGTNSIDDTGSGTVTLH